LGDLGATAVPIESLAFEGQPVFADRGAAAPAPAAPVVVRGPLETTFADYRARLERQPAPTPSLDELLDRAAPAVEEPVPAAVAIETLCYRGRGALERAAEIRQHIRARLTSDVAITELRPLLEELLDLVPLALAEPD
jgi:hypothetical protein